MAQASGIDCAEDDDALPMEVARKDDDMFLLINSYITIIIYIVT